MVREVGDINTVITSKEAILEASRILVRERGWSAINIRSVAAACGVAVGSIYNYYDSKSELVAATVESVWCDIFHQPEKGQTFSSFLDCIDWIYQCMKEGGEKYPGFFALHPLSFTGEEKKEGQRLMAQSWRHIKGSLCSVLRRDSMVRFDAFCGEFTEEAFVNLIFSIILSALLQHNYDSTIVKEVIRRSIY